MTTLKFTAKKMSDAVVSHISLVERGANRTPFKIMKSTETDKGMSKLFSGLDLGNLGRMFTNKGEAPATPSAEVIGVVTMSGEAFEAVKKQIEDAGFDVSKETVAADGSVFFQQGETLTAEGDTLIRLNDHVAIVTKGFSPYSMESMSDGVSFADACNAKGFYPGVSTIMETLGDSIRKSVNEAESPAAASAAVAKVFKEAQAYAAQFIQSLPVKTFKLESISVEVPEDKTTEVDPTAAAQAEEDLKAALGVSHVCKTCGDSEVVDSACASCGNDPVVEPDAVYKAELVEKGDKMTPAEKEFFATLTGAPRFAFLLATTAERAVTMGGAKPAKPAAAPAAAPAKKDEVNVEEAIAKALKGFTEQLSDALAGVSAIQKTVAGFESGIAAIAGRMDEAEKIAKSAQQAVGGMTVVGSDAGDPMPTMKNEGTQVRGDFDTAYNPRVRTRAQVGRH
jgi:soluble cytochrome b562/translation initiation factor 6 (eIF-6)